MEIWGVQASGALSFPGLHQAALLSICFIQWKILFGKSIPLKLFEHCWPMASSRAWGFRGLASSSSFAAISFVIVVVVSVIVVPSVDFSFFIYNVGIKPDKP